MKKLKSIILSLILLLTLVRPTYAHCPLCVAGAAAGITLTRWVGVDDSITGIWIGAFLGASSFWLLRILGQKNKIFFNRFIRFIVYVFIFVITLWSFYRFNLVGKMGDVFGFDKLTFGMVVGALVFYLVDILNGYIKRKNGKSLFPYQSIVFSLSSMVLSSVAVYILINYYI
ncbi:hypothetical protein A3A75_05240 [Candidatus Woesebacteria bacterium RIFCSPLOWO2_01_FULL_39_10]|uniref:Uncharacterized protein n=1 Tax=Candidatus Woesebacteria bacterium RIFCSPLOWO2_01_FULL_39_10 TaxID=1802516 RepID=A0A1F8B4U4_9BACT|nr:MAG: hypothetical protein A3A75_05240 [Candidatus Woesebacteria bacterium RIFCSPLOWO2_01_FULL_39_10]